MGKATDTSMVNLPSSELEPIRRLHEMWWRRALPEHVESTEGGLFQRARAQPPLPQAWMQSDGLLLEPSMLLTAELQPPPWAPAGGPTWHGGVTFNALSPNFRIPFLTGIMGCPMQVSTIAQTIWPRAYLLDDWYRLPNQGFRPRPDWLDKHLEFLEFIKARYTPDQCLVAPSSGHGIGDALVTMLGPERCYLELYDHPEEIKRLLERITDTYIGWVKAQLEIVPQVVGGTITQYGIWAPGSFVKTQEDYAVNLSPAQFSEFILPCLRRLLETFDRNIIHTHTGTQTPLWLLELDRLTAIEMGIDPNGPHGDDLVRLIERILERVPIIILGTITESELELLTAQLRPGGVWFDVATVEDDAALADYAWFEK